MEASSPSTITVSRPPSRLLGLDLSGEEEGHDRSFGQSFHEQPAIKIASVRFANANSEDWNVPSTPSKIADWQALGYTSEKLLAAGQQLIDAAVAAFPH